MEALPLLEVELRLMVPDLVWVPDLLAPAPLLGLPSAEGDEAEPKPASARPGSAQGLAAMWASWVQTLLSASGRVGKLDAAEGAFVYLHGLYAINAHMLHCSVSEPSSACSVVGLGRAHAPAGQPGPNSLLDGANAGLGKLSHVAKLDWRGQRRVCRCP